jgi:hypothetical protein
MAALMPLAWAFGLTFSPMGAGGGAGFTSGGSTPAALATSSGGSSGAMGRLGFSPMTSGIAGAALTLGPASSAAATASGSGSSRLAFTTWSPMPAAAIAGVQGGPATLQAFSSGLQAVTFQNLGRFDFSPMSGANGGFQGGRAQSFVFNVTVVGGGSVPANSGTSLTVTVPGVLASDSIQANQTSATFSAGISIVNAYASGAGQITLQILNCTTASQAIPSNFPLRVAVLRG